MGYNIVADANKNISKADRGNRWIQVFDSEGSLLRMIMSICPSTRARVLQDDVAAMAHSLRADLDETSSRPQARQRSLLDRLWQSQRPHEVREIVG